MSDRVLKVRLAESSEISYSSLSPDDRRVVDGWLDHLCRWPDDEFARTRSRRLKADEELYAFQANSNDLILAFRVTNNEIEVVSILREGWLKGFEAVPHRAAV